jgi:uncharacterized protein YndB with AHSA1/START domain
MRFELTQRYASPAEEVDRAYADPDLYPALVGLPKLGRINVLAHDARGDSPASRLRVQFHFTGDLPAAVTAVVDPDRLSWVQESEHDHDARRAQFRLVPDHYPDRLRCSGRFVVTEARGGAARTVSGDLRVQALLVASRVERAIISGLEEYLAAEADAVDRWISSQAR